MIVFTNGCFDILHAGHVDLLERARALGSKLIVGLNSDTSVRSIKGPGRPLVKQEARKAVLLGLSAVDEVLIFDDPTPERLIRDVKPDILVKGGDWKVNEIIGADFVLQNGGEVQSLPLMEGFSTSSIIDRMKGDAGPGTMGRENDSIANSISEHLEVLSRLEETQTETIQRCSELLFKTLSNERKILLCGNGGSAADAQHIAAEFVGRFEAERRALPAIALTTDTSTLTALANDYNVERIFSRQVEALAKEGDCLIAISTSGNSPNVIAAVMTARSNGCKVIGFTGENGKKLASLCDVCLMVPSTRTARIQEAHITVAHILCEMIDRKFFEIQAPA